MNEDVIQQSNNSILDEINNAIAQRQQDYSNMTGIGYDTEQYLEQVQYSTPQGSYINYGPDEYIKDAFTSWVTGLNQAQYSADMGKFMLAQNTIEDLQNAERYLNLIGEGNNYSSIDPNIINGYTKALQELGIDSSVSVDTQYRLINERINELVDDQNEYLKDANTDLQDMQDWQDKWEISDYYKQKEQDPADYTIDSMLYKLPGIMGSSSSSIGWQALGMLGSIVGTVGSIALAPVTGGSSVAAWGALAVGAAASLTGNIMAGRDENAAEVYDNLKTAITQDMNKDGSYNNLIKQGRQLLKDGINAKELNIPEAINASDVDKMTDDRVMDYILNRTVNTSNSDLERTINNRLPATEELFLRDMATTVGTDILTTGIDILPIGIVAKGTRLGRYGVKMYNKAKDAVLGSNLNRKLDRIVHFGLSDEAKNVIKRRNIDFTYNIAKRNVISALAEGPGEEGVQYLNGQEFIKGKYGQEMPSWVEAYAESIGDKAQSIWAFMSPFDAAEQYDEEWLENSRSGVLMGIFNFPSVLGNVRDIAQNVRNNQALRQVQEGLIQKVFEDKTQWNQAKFFADRVSKINRTPLRYITSGETAINEAFNAFSNFMPDEFTQEAWQEQRDIFNNIRNLAKSKTLEQLTEQRGYVVGSNEYNTYLALLEYKRQKRQEALDVNNAAEQEADKKVQEIKKKHSDVDPKLLDIIHKNAKLQAAERLLQLIKDQEEDVAAFRGKLNKRDVSRVKETLKNIVDNQNAILGAAKKENPALGIIDSLELPDSQEDLIQAEVERLSTEIALQVHSQDFNALYTNKNNKPQVQYVDKDGQTKTRELTDKEIDDNIKYSKEIVDRFIKVEAANRRTQQDMRTGNVQESQTEIPIPTTPVQPTPPPAPVAPEPEPEPNPAATPPTPSEPSRPTPKTQPEPATQSQEETPELPPMPEDAVIPGVGEKAPPTSVGNGLTLEDVMSQDELDQIRRDTQSAIDEVRGQNASESSSQPSQAPQTPTPEQQPTSKPESSTEPENASTKQSTKDDGRYISEDLYQKARARLRSKLGQLNAGIDPEMLQDTIIVAAYHLENGVRKFVQFAKAMIADLGENVKPYLQSAYEGARTLPNNPYRQDMDNRTTVDEYVANNFKKLDEDLSEQPKSTDSKPAKPTSNISKEKIKELNNKIRAIKDQAYEELKDSKYDNIKNRDIIEQLRNFLNVFSITVNDNSDPAIEQDVNQFIETVNGLLEQLRLEYQRYLESQNDNVNTFAQGGYPLVIAQEDQVKAITLLNADDLLEQAEIVLDDVEVDEATGVAYPRISIHYKGEVLHATLLYSDRNPKDNTAAQKYPELVKKLKRWLELQRSNPGKYKIIPVGLARTSGKLIKQNPGYTYNMVDVSFWNDVLKGYGVTDPTDPYQINGSNFILAVVDRNSNLRRGDDIYGVRKTPYKGYGDVFWIARIPRKDAPGGYVTHRVLVNPTRLNQLPGSAEVIVEALKQYIVNGTNTQKPFMQDGKETPFTPQQVLNLLTYFGNDPANDTTVSPQENINRMNKSFDVNFSKNYIKIADKTIDINAFLQSKDVQNQVVQILYDAKYSFHVPLREEQIVGISGAKQSPNNPLAPLRRFFENRPEVRRFELFPGMDFTPEMVGLGKHRDGINWLGYIVSKRLINPGYTAIQNRIYASDFQLQQSGPEADAQETKVVDDAVKDDNTDNSGDPFADAFDGMDLLFTSESKPEKMSQDRKDQARRTIARLTDLSEDQVEILDDILATTSAGLYVMGRAKLDSIVLSRYDIPGIEYHEAWHRISNLLISPQQRDKVFRQVRRKYGNKLTDTEVDEILAERFREFQLDTAEVIDYTTTNLFKRIWNFIRTWAKLGNLRLARIYYRINTGKYASVKPSEENIARFKELYEDQGPNFTFNGAEFKQFANRYALNRAIDSLMYYVFYNPKSKVSFYKDATDINFYELYKMLKRSKKLSLQELANDENGNWQAVKQALTQRLQALSIRVSDVEEKELENLADSGALARINMDDYTKASYEIDVLGNQTADVKFFLSTVPQYAPDYESGIFKPVLDEVTGLPKFYDIRYIWNVASTDLGMCKTLQELIQRVDELASTDYMYAGIRWKLNQYLKLMQSEDENVRTDTEGALTRILTALRKQKLQFDTLRVTRNEEGGYNMQLVDNTVDNKTRVLPGMWSQIFLTQTDTFEIDDNNVVTLTEEGRKNLKAVLKAYERLKYAFNNNGLLTIGGETYDLHLPVNQSRAKNFLVKMLANIGIHVEQGTINQLLKDPKYGGDSYTKLYNLIVRSDINYGGLPRLFDAISSIVNSNDMQNLVLSSGSKVPIGEIYNKLGFINELAAADVIFHKNHDNLMDVGAGNNLIYGKSDNNFVSDRLNQLNNDEQLVQQLLESPWNHYDQTIQNEDGSTDTRSISSSIILDAVMRGDKLRLSVFQNFKTDNYGDQGSDYHQINEIEDYLAKMELVLNGRLIFPTMEAKKTYYSISGIDLNLNSKLEVVNLPGVEQQVIFSNDILDRWINYFQADYNAAMTTISQLTEGSPDYIPEDQRITNYHTPVKWWDSEGNMHTTDPNGTRLRLFNGMYTLEQGKDGKYHYEYIAFDNPNESSADILKKAKAKFFDQPLDIKRSIINKILNERLKDEIRYCIGLGLVQGNVDDFLSLTSNKLDSKILSARSSRYDSNIHSMAVLDVIADTMNRSMISFVEIQKTFVGDPAFFKWTYDENGLVENTIDLIKRHGGLISTGINNRTDLEDFNPFYRTAELKDYKQGSDQLDYLLKVTSEGYLIEFVKQNEGISEAMSGDIEVLKKEYPELWDAAQTKAKIDFGGYKAGINVADAAVYITPEFYARLMRSTGEWNAEIKEAYDILINNTADWYTQVEAYGKVMKASLRALKYVAYGTRFENGTAVPYFNKMALFPIFKQIATGDMQKVYERMTKADDKIDMLMFESAVKVGSKHPTSSTDLDNLVVYSQDIQYLRQQLNTKGHPEPHVTVGTQMLKVALGNLDLQGDYNGTSGEQIRNNIMGCINNLSDRGVMRLSKEFLDKYGVLDVEKFAEKMQQYFRENPGNDNLVNGVQIVEDPVTHQKRLRLPISAMSDASFLESVLLSMINRETVDIEMPGGAFIQRSAFGIFDSYNIASDNTLNGGRKLKMIDEKDGSMHCIVSITLFRDLLPNFDKLTFAQQRKALMDAGIIGEESEPIDIGYRIPTQAQASISALKVVDVLPAIMEDTIILPEEFTKLTGSDMFNV